MIISIDGASRRNGKPDCLAAGGVFFKMKDSSKISTVVEKPSSNQRGEMLALITALSNSISYAKLTDDKDIYIITDSEYLYNTITKDWLSNWKNKGWITAGGTPVKNQDLWENISNLLQDHEDAGNEIMCYHIKGHLMSLGKVTARNILYGDPTGRGLYHVLWTKYEEAVEKKPTSFDDAAILFERNHGYKLDEKMFKEFVVCNTVADYIAGTYCDRVDSE